MTRTKRAFFWCFMPILSIFMISEVRSSQQNAGELFEKALYMEEARGELEQAIDLYRKILKQFPDNREIGAKAQLHIGLCFEKLGKTEAIKAYELVLKNFADQPDQVVTARARLSALREEKSSGITVTQLTLADWYYYAVALSPDGTRTVGNDYSIGGNIAVYDHVANKKQLITRFDSKVDSLETDLPVWSPDGKEIVYSQRDSKEPESSELWISNLKGESRLLFRSEGGEIVPYDWLHDGSAIVAKLKKSDGPVTLGLVPATGGSFNPLRSLKSEALFFAERPSASPDGRFIMYEDGSPGSRDIYIIGTDGKFFEVLTDHPADDRDPLWSPDGRHIVFLSQRHGAWALWGVAVNNGKPAGNPFMIKEGMHDSYLLNWTLEGLCYMNWNQFWDVFVMPVDPANGEPLERPKLVQYSPTGGNRMPVWSPNGKYLAFGSNALEEPRRGHIVVLPVDGGKARKFLIPSRNYWIPSLMDLRWLPDSSGLGFTCRDNNGQPALFLIMLETGEWKILPYPAQNWSRIEWASDGKSCLYAKWGKEDPGIIEHNLETGRERYVYRPKKEDNEEINASFTGLKCSRDYRWLVFRENTNRNGLTTKPNLMAVDLETGDSRVIIPGFAGSACWSPDGQYFLISPGRRFFIIPFRGGTPKKRLGNFISKEGRIADVDWSPDGKNVSFTSLKVIEGRTGPFLMKNLIPEDKRQ